MSSIVPYPFPEEAMSISLHSSGHFNQPNIFWMSPFSRYCTRYKDPTIKKKPFLPVRAVSLVLLSRLLTKQLFIINTQDNTWWINRRMDMQVNECQPLFQKCLHQSCCFYPESSFLLSERKKLSHVSWLKDFPLSFETKLLATPARRVCCLWIVFLLIVFLLILATEFFIYI